MFNTGRFNRLRFNVRTGDEGDVLLVYATMQAVIGSMLRFGGNIRETVFAAALAEASVNGAAGTLVRETLAADVAAKGAAYRVCYAEVSAGCGVRAAITPYLTIYAPLNLSADVRSHAETSMLVRVEAAMRAYTQRYAYLSKNTRIKPTILDAAYSSQISTVRFAVSYADYDIDIPPGSTVVIDSAGYVVLLDGEDVIYAHSGDWLRLSRRTHDITFESAGGELLLDKQILYTERWL